MENLRSLPQICKDIKINWVNIDSQANTTLSILEQLKSESDSYYGDPAVTIINNMLNNLRFWFGKNNKQKEFIKQIKRELFEMTL